TRAAGRRRWRWTSPSPPPRRTTAPFAPRGRRSPTGATFGPALRPRTARLLGERPEAGELGCAQVTPLPLGEPIGRHVPHRDPDQLEDGLADGLAHAADLPVEALGERELHPRVAVGLLDHAQLGERLRARSVLQR